jgi:hypothetical protein
VADQPLWNVQRYGRDVMKSGTAKKICIILPKIFNFHFLLCFFRWLNAIRNRFVLILLVIRSMIQKRDNPLFVVV